MDEPGPIRVPKWPFFLGDAFLLGLAYFIYAQGKGPLTRWEIVALGTCVALGALLGVVPFFLEYRAALKLVEVSAVGTALEKIQKLETIATQISGATNHWQFAQEQADKTAALSREIADRMAGEVRDFTEFMQKINEGERATLRLELEKLRRAENEWLNVVVHTLDHVYALCHAAERSGQKNLIAQLHQFQNACRDAARRVGLVPFIPEPAEGFNPQRHQSADGKSPPEGAVVDEVLATGFTFQGRLLRPAMVQVRTGSLPPTETSEAESKELSAEPSDAQAPLPLEPERANPA